ncbi:hypothetical protein [Alicyclobacillus fodiniaquatilis]|uniref:Uncharacterized protein n=1 Tax=Alicyclobacillus fodiniaquatilis TaxID=1661150 RepID=A0ABW4JK56_9BACL
MVRMTAKGRRLVREATGEVRPKRLPVGTLKEWHWRALSTAYTAAESGVYDECGDYGGISWKTWLRLREYKHKGENRPFIKEVEIGGSSSYNRITL